MNGLDDKLSLRGRMLTRRATLSALQCRQASQALCERLLALPELATARCLASYAAFRNEIDTAELCEHARTRGVVTALPRMAPGDTLTLHAAYAAGEGAALEVNALGVAEPPADSPQLDGADVDVILIPAVAVDAAGRRLGFGRGFYDRLLPTLTHALKVAVVHDFQIAPRVPTAAHDVPVDVVVSDARTLRIGGA